MALELISAAQIAERYFAGSVSVEWVLDNIPGKRRYGYRTIRWFAADVETWLRENGAMHG